LSFSNKGGLVMPIIIEWTFKDGTKEIDRIPAQIWRLNEEKVKKFFVKNKEVVSIQLDPYQETADIDVTNNSWRTMPAPTRFKAYSQEVEAPGRRRSKNTGKNPMQLAQ